MRTTWIPFIVIAVTNPAARADDKVITPNLGAIAESKGWTIYNTTAETAEIDGKPAVHLIAEGDSANGVVGLVLADGVEFTTGVIELDLKGKNVRGRSFLGVAFNVAGEKTFEAIYFRPFNIKAEGEFKNRAVQYINWPKHTWEELRKSRPGKFEGAVNSVPDPDKWFHARIEVGDKQVRVFANDAKEPCLTVDRFLDAKKSKRVGLFVDSADGYYANLKIVPNK
jgi:hypothetical protein